jgi:hypothetical protein
MFDDRLNSLGFNSTYSGGWNTDNIMDRFKSFGKSLETFIKDPRTLKFIAAAGTLDNLMSGHPNLMDALKAKTADLLDSDDSQATPDTSPPVQGETSDDQSIDQQNQNPGNVHLGSDDTGVNTNTETSDATTTVPTSTPVSTSGRKDSQQSTINNLTNHGANQNTTQGDNMSVIDEQTSGRKNSQLSTIDNLTDHGANPNNNDFNPGINSAVEDQESSPFSGSWSDFITQVRDDLRENYFQDQRNQDASDNYLDQMGTMFDRFFPNTSQWERLGAAGGNMASGAGATQSAQEQHRMAKELKAMDNNTAKDVAKIQAERAGVSKAEKEFLQKQSKHFWSQNVRNVGIGIAGGSQLLPWAKFGNKNPMGFSGNW